MQIHDATCLPQPKKTKLEQLDAERLDGQRKNAEAHHRDERAQCQCGPEAEAGKQARKDQEHRQRRHDIPKRIPGVVRNLLRRLLVQIEPSQRKQCYQREGREQRTQSITALGQFRSEEHTSELQSLMRISYAGFCSKKKTKRKRKTQHTW